MPELPEVETVCRGVAPHITDQIIQRVIVRQSRLRWPVPGNLNATVSGAVIRSVSRRAKYLLIETDRGTLIIHLGMSGSLRLVTSQQAIKIHDHIDFVFAENIVMRYNDPRRFGAVLWTTDPITEHPLLKDLGPEPLLSDFSGEHLHSLAKNRKIPIKSFIMDSHVVVGVGNIYANEALFMAGIHPCKPVGQIALVDYQKLADCIRTALVNAIAQGGTTLRDFVNEAGKPGYFQQQLRVYGRAGLPCIQCRQPLQETRLSNRSTVFCPNCQQ